jgi:RNA polymerase sigma-70 factor (ECF subfamily)
MEERVKAAKSGDSEAFRQLMDAEKMKLYAIALSYLKNEDDALEAVQETVCRAYVKLGKLREPRYFRTWLTRILIHCCIDEQKRKRKTMPLFTVTDTLASDLALDEKWRMRMEIGRLPANLRHIIILKYYEDMTLPEIARVLDKPEGTVKTWLNRALKLLRKALRKEEEGHVQPG